MCSHWSWAGGQLELGLAVSEALQALLGPLLLPTSDQSSCPQGLQPFPGGGKRASLKREAGGWEADPKPRAGNPDLGIVAQLIGGLGVVVSKVLQRCQVTTRAWRLLLQSAPGVPGFKQAGWHPETPVAVKQVLKFCFATCAGCHSQ